jgi:hypothetical protein
LPGKLPDNPNSGESVRQRSGHDRGGKRFPSDEEADARLDRPRRKGFDLPQVSAKNDRIAVTFYCCLINSAIAVARASPKRTKNLPLPK